MDPTGESDDPSALRTVDVGSLPDLFDTVLDQSGTGVMVFDAELRIAYVNEVAARIGGYPVDLHVGRRLEDLHPQIAVQADPLLADALAGEEAIRDHELVWESPRPPHDRRFWLVSYVPLRTQDGTPYVAAIYAETTQVRRAHERLTRLIDALPTFVGMCTPDGIIIEANEATLAAADLHREDLVGHPLWEAVWWSHDPSVRRRIHDAVVLAQEGRTSRFDVEAKVGDDVRATLDFQLVPIVERGAVTALVPSALDISERIAERDRLQALAALSRHLNGATTTEDVTRLVLSHASAVVDATFADLALLDRDRRELRVAHLSEPDGPARWGRLSLGGPRTAFHDVVRSGRTLFVDRATRASAYPEMVAHAERLGVDTTAAAALEDEDGVVFGVLRVGWPGTVDDLHHVRLRLELLADLCSDALRRAERTDAQDRFIRELQDEVLAPADTSDPLDVAVGHEPAQAHIGFGGDWYDVIDVDDGCAAVVVGDVAGHGIAAAARMTEAKATIRAMVLTADREQVIPSANRSLAHLGSAYVATATIVWIDTADHSIAWTAAGHPPPVLRTPDGAVSLLEGPQHPPVGSPTEARTPPARDFPPGSLLVLYTDGLIERRGEAIDVGMERLRVTVESLPEGCTAAEASDALLGALHVGHREDDVAIVVVRSG